MSKLTSKRNYAFAERGRFLEYRRGSTSRPVPCSDDSELAQQFSGMAVGLRNRFVITATNDNERTSA